MSAAASIASRIGQLIAVHNSKSFESNGKHLDRVSSIKDLWARVRQIPKKTVQSQISQPSVPSSSIYTMQIFPLILNMNNHYLSQQFLKIKLFLMKSQRSISLTKSNPPLRV